MFFYLPGQEQEIARSATIPHGDSLLALGSANTISGPPQFTPVTAIPDAGAQMPLGYLDVYQTVKGIDVHDVNSPLTAANQGLDIVSTTTLELSTQPPGGIVNIPFVDQNANATEFSCAFWIETIKDAETGDEVLQLQYRQQTNICFLKKFDDSGDLIMWPHINVNTMRKQ